MSKKELFTQATPFQAKPGSLFKCSEVAISAERTRLLPISEKYAREIFENFTSEVAHYMSPQPADCIEDTLAFISNALQGMERGENLQFVILHKESGEFLGCCGLHGQGCPTTPELGIWLKRAAQGNRYGKEAITAVKQWADEYLRYRYLTYPVDRDNTPSRKIPEALGSEIYEESLCPTRDGRFLDMVIYRIYAVDEGKATMSPAKRETSSEDGASPAKEASLDEKGAIVPLGEVSINQAGLAGRSNPR
jgi:ribosomal-protein-alanine N-acetyltransferase